jgi:hypothetical protein
MAYGKNDPIRIEVDLGGTKIEFVALDRDGAELHHHRDVCDGPGVVVPICVPACGREQRGPGTDRRRLTGESRANRCCIEVRI